MRTLMLSAVCVGLLGACAQPRIHLPPPDPLPPTEVPCEDRANCHISVEVVKCNPPQPPLLVVNPPGLQLKGPGGASGSQPNVVWKIMTPGYVFEPNGVWINAPVGEFSSVSSTDAAQFILKANRSVFDLEFKYTLLVKRLATATSPEKSCGMFDPFIINRS